MDIREKSLFASLHVPDIVKEERQGINPMTFGSLG